MANARDKMSFVLGHLERTVDHQVHVMEEIDEKVVVLLGIAVGLVGVGMALLAAVLSRSGAGATAGAPAEASTLLAATIGGLTLNAASVVLLLHGYVGLTPGTAPRYAHGPEPGWLRRVAFDPDWSYEAIVRAVIQGFVTFSAHLDRELGRLMRLRRLGLYAVLGTAGL